MSEFSVVLPSNVKSGEVKNTPAHYTTHFDSDIFLPESENWEVALHEISFVDSIETIHDEYFEYATEGTTKSKVFLPKQCEKVNITNKDLECYLQVDRSAFEIKVDGVFEIAYDSKFEKYFITTKKSGVKLSMPKLYAHVWGLKRMPQKKGWDKPLSRINVETQKKTIIKPENRVDILVKFHVDKTEKPKEFKEWVHVYYEKPHEIHYFPHPVTWSQKDKITIGVMGSPSTICKFEYTPYIQERVQIKRGYYKTGDELVKQLNKKYKLFSFDAVSNRFTITGSEIVLDKTLASILGFKDTKLVRNATAEHAPNFRRGIYAVFVYANICEPTRVGNSTAPLLRTVSFQRGTFGETVNIIYNNPIFVPVSKRYINSIEIMLKDDMGEDIPFEEGKTIITLLFRKYA